MRKAAPRPRLALMLTLLSRMPGGVAVHESGIAGMNRPPVNSPVLPWIETRSSVGVGARALDGEAAGVPGHDDVREH